MARSSHDGAFHSTLLAPLARVSTARRARGDARGASNARIVPTRALSGSTRARSRAQTRERVPSGAHPRDAAE